MPEAILLADWESSLKKAKDEHRDWSVNDVFQNMEKLGWTVEDVHATTVAY